MSRRALLGVTALLVLLGFGVLGYLVLSQLNRVEERLGAVDAEIRQTGQTVETTAANAAEALDQSRQALERAERAELNAEEAARLRERAESQAAEAQAEAAAAQAAAAEADALADEARADLEQLRRERQEEMDRLERALGEMVETRRTALGLVMNLGSDSIEFAFDDATLRPEDRELLSRIAGVLLTSGGYAIYVYGHTDDVGSEEYNQALSERRAASVRDYLVEAGIDPEIISTQGFGKSSPRVEDTSSEARAKNRRVEIGVVDVRLDYQAAGADP